MHFNVAVIHKENQDIYDILAPYSEYMEVEPYIWRTKAEIIEDGKARKEQFKQWKLEGKEIEEWMQEYLNAETDEDIYSLEKYDCEYYDSEGNELETYNPNSRYDWFAIGGRWHGMLKLKNSEPDENSDSARIKNIDFSIKEKELQAHRRFWEVVVENSSPKEDEREMDFFSIYGAEYYKANYKDKEDYAVQMAKFCTRAVVTPDGEWHEPGQMGWFSSSETKDEWREWVDNYLDIFIYPQDPNLYLTIIDCHI